MNMYLITHDKAAERDGIQHNSKMTLDNLITIINKGT